MIDYILDGEATCRSGIGDDYSLMERRKVKESGRKNKSKEVLHHKQASSRLRGMSTFPTPLFTTNEPSIPTVSPQGTVLCSDHSVSNQIGLFLLSGAFEVYLLDGLLMTLCML
jgi:hypothetical protein